MERWTDRLPVGYQDVIKTWTTYWNLYKGTGSAFRSPYLHLAILLSFLLFPWLGCGYSQTTWSALALGIFPNLMGFTLGGYAILVAFGDRTFMRKLCGPDKDGRASPYMELNAMFVHFILMQGLAILLAYLSKATGVERGVFALLGSGISIYALLLALSATLTVMRFAESYDDFVSTNNQTGRNDEEQSP
jgi:hypothetical protein